MYRNILLGSLFWWIFHFFNVEIIRGFTSTFVATCSDNSHPFAFTSRIKRPPPEIIKFLVNKFRDQDNKVTSIHVDEYGSIARSSEFRRTCHNMKIIVQTTGGYASSLNGKSEIPNKTLDNITRALILISIHNKELWCFTYHYSMCLSFLTDNRLHGDVTYFLWNGSIPS